METCKFQYDECVNCSGPHKCLSDKCIKFSQKKLHINRFVLRILVGENLISSTSDILQFKKETKQFQMPNNTNRCLNHEIESILSSKFSCYESKIKSLEQLINNQSCSVRDIKENLELVSKNIPDIRSNIKIFNENLNNFAMKISNTIDQTQSTSTDSNGEIQKNYSKY